MCVCLCVVCLCGACVWCARVCGWRVCVGGELTSPAWLHLRTGGGRAGTNQAGAAQQGRAARCRARAGWPVGETRSTGLALPRCSRPPSPSRAANLPGPHAPVSAYRLMVGRQSRAPCSLPGAASPGSRQAVSTTDQCRCCRKPWVGRGPTPYCGHAIWTPPLQGPGQRGGHDPMSGLGHARPASDAAAWGSAVQEASTRCRLNAHCCGEQASNGRTEAPAGQACSERDSRGSSAGPWPWCPT